MSLPRVRDLLRNRGFWPLFIGLAVWNYSSGSAQVGISFVDMFRSDAYRQTANGNSLSPIGSFFSSDLVSSNPGDFSAVQMTYPGPGSPVNLAPLSPTLFRYQTPFLPNQAAMDAAYPFGTYQYNATGGSSGPASTMFDYTADHYPQTLPFLGGTNFSDLQGMNSQAPFQFQFSPFATGTGVDFSYMFFTIFDRTTNTFAFVDNFLPSTTTGLTLPANTLQPGDQYTYELIFSNRLLAPSPGADFEAQIGYDLRTQGDFAAAPAVPEPWSLLLLVQGGACWALVYLRRRARTSPPA